MTTTSADAPRPGHSLPIGILLLALATVLFALGLSPFLVALNQSSAAAFAVPLALCGLPLGAMVVHFLPGLFSAGRASGWITLAALACSLAIAAASGSMIFLPHGPDTVSGPRLTAIGAILAVPFVFSGMAATLALARFPGDAHRPHGFALGGTALGIVLFEPLVTRLGISGFLMAAALVAALGAFVLAFALAGHQRRVILATAALAVAGLQTYLLSRRGEFPIQGAQEISASAHALTLLALPSAPGALLTTTELFAAAVLMAPSMPGRRAGAYAAQPLLKRFWMAVFFIMFGLGTLVTVQALLRCFAGLFAPQPTPGFTRCLAVLLAAGAAGSLASAQIFRLRSPKDGPLHLTLLSVFTFAGLLAILAFYYFIMRLFDGSLHALFAGLSIVLLVPVAGLIGMALPLALRAAALVDEAPLAWFCALAGAVFILALALYPAMIEAYGLMPVTALGVFSYLVATVAGQAFYE